MNTVSIRSSEKFLIFSGVMGGFKYFSGVRRVVNKYNLY